MSKSKDHFEYSSQCPGCSSTNISVFYKIQDAPVNSVLLLDTQEEAMDFPLGAISLGLCNSCGFIYNLAFDSSLLEYSTRYEATQGFSSTFNAFHRDLAKRLIDQYNLHDKDIIEIGCGQGEFITLLCEMGNNRGIGFDPVFNTERNDLKTSESVRFIKDFYSEEYSQIRCDFICCKMTLEHIPDTARFVSMISHTLQEQKETIVFFQVPDTTRVWRELAFWDIYYEHCSYFSQGSLSRLFQKNGFDVIGLEKGYDDQYLMITAKLNAGKPGDSKNSEDLESLKQDIAYFSKNYQQKIAEWKNKIDSIHQTGKRAVIWGASSKGVSFLTTLKIRNEIQYAVDINPHKQNTFVAGTGQKIVIPEFLRTYKPDFVIIMNPIYTEEIREKLNELEVSAEILTV